VSIDERIEALAAGQANLQVALSSLLSSQAALQVQFGRMENELLEIRAILLRSPDGGNGA
jgi:hypothetical protein